MTESTINLKSSKLREVDYGRVQKVGQFWLSYIGKTFIQSSATSVAKTFHARKEVYQSIYFRECTALYCILCDVQWSLVERKSSGHSQL